MPIGLVVTPTRGVIGLRKVLKPVRKLALKNLSLGSHSLPVAATVEFSGFMREFVATRRREPRQDFLSQFVTATDSAGQGLADDEIVTMAILLLNAGHEATVHSLGNGVRAILEEVPDPAAAVALNPAGHVEEMLRYDAPLHMFTRYALEDVEVAGERFRKGDVIGLLLGSANRDLEEPGADVEQDGSVIA